MDRDDVYTMDQALERMRGLIGYAGDWAALESFLPEGWARTRRGAGRPPPRPSRRRWNWPRPGKIEIRQGETFAPIQIRRRPDA